MIRWIKKSVKRQLFLSFLFTALIPLILGGSLLIQMMKAKIRGEYKDRIIAQSVMAEEAMDSYFGSFKETAIKISKNKTIINGIDTTDSWNRNRAYSEFYRESFEVKEYARFEIYNRYGKCVYSTDNSRESMELPLYWGVLRVADYSGEDLEFIRGNDIGKSEDILFHSAMPLKDRDEATVGYVVISLKEKHFDKILNDIGRNLGGMIVMDSYWETVYRDDIAEKENAGEFVRNYLLSGEKLKRGMTSNNMFVSKIDKSNLYLVLLSPEIFDPITLKNMYQVLFAMAFVISILCLFSASVFSEKFIMPINVINNAMNEVRTGNLTVRVPGGRADEFGKMSENFNVMAGELSEYMEEKIEQQNEINASQIALMQAQLNPHFLYNTLDTIKWVAKEHHIAEIATLSASLAKILRSSIASEQFVPLKKELEFVNCYIDIQKIRFSDKFIFETDIEAGLEEYLVPKRFIQPIVENSIIHGLQDKDDGIVRLTVKTEENNIVAIIYDNGCGIDEAIMEEINNRNRQHLKGHIGVANVDTIICLKYGSEYGIKVQKPISGGTEVRVLLPKVY